MNSFRTELKKNIEMAADEVYEHGFQSHENIDKKEFITEVIKYLNLDQDLKNCYSSVDIHEVATKYLNELKN